MNRTTKQLVISSVYLTMFGMLLFGVYLKWFNIAPTCFDSKKNQDEVQIDCGGVCTMSCALKYPQFLQVIFAKSLPVSSSRSDVLAQIKNPNLTVGASEIIYHIALENATGEMLEERDGSTFIYPGKLKYIYESGFNVGATDVENVTLTITDAKFAVEDRFYSKNIITSNVSLEKQKDSLRITGTARNNGDLVIDDLYATGIIYDASKKNVLAASATLVKTVLSRENRFFEINFPSSLLQFLPLTGKEQVEVELAAPPLQE
ncbi:MAG: hypothetical protein HZA35_00310 [Parcubacteria group bacterium]|nr:hypothetical protein [Parcubacteria group bacterium]